MIYSSNEFNKFNAYHNNVNNKKTLTANKLNE